MFRMLTKVLFTALCAHLSVFFVLFFHSTGIFFNLFFGGGGGGGDLNCSDQNMKIKGKSPSQEFTIFFIETCSRNMFTSLMVVNLSPTKLARYTNKIFFNTCTINSNPVLSLFFIRNCKVISK